MSRLILKANIFLKGFLLAIKPHIFLSWLAKPMFTTSNIIALSKWIAAQEKQTVLNDFYTTKRDYSKRYQLYQAIIDQHQLKNEAVDYLEFGVSQAHSFKWWLNANTNPNSKFVGFDTFEGLPEAWGMHYDKGAMSANIPQVNDVRASFEKGLFQATLPNFILNYNLKNNRKKIIHLDADLFSSTLFALTSLAPYLSKGDILLFDEFNVPNHEFFAFKMFCDSYYVKTKLLAAVNNYYQIAVMIE